jgi:type II secretory pathway pseudopilin PulG
MDSGFTLIEMLVATSISVTAIAAVLAVLAPVEGMFRAQPEVSDMQQRIRVATDALRADLLMAGAGIDAPPAEGSLFHYFAPILPYRTGDMADDRVSGIRFRNDAITVVYAPATSSQTTIRDRLTADSRELTVDLQPNCPRPTERQVCGFEEGMRMLLLDSSGIHDIVTVGAVQNPVVGLEYAGRLSATYSSGMRVAQVETRTYYLKTSGGAPQLMVYDGHRSDVPLVDNVVGLEFRYFGDPQPPILRDLNARDASPTTTYGPAPPAIDVDNDADAWPMGENCVFAVQQGDQVSRLPVLASGHALVPLSSSMLVDGPWCPDEAHPNRFDADLLRVRRIAVTLRVQAAPASLRGPAGTLFVHGGSARSGDRFVPDQEIRFDVTPRNLNVER